MSCCKSISTQARTHFQQLPSISITALVIVSEAEDPGLKLSILFPLYSGEFPFGNHDQPDQLDGILDEGGWSACIEVTDIFRWLVCLACCASPTYHCSCQSAVLCILVSFQTNQLTWPGRRNSRWRTMISMYRSNCHIWYYFDIDYQKSLSSAHKDSFGLHNLEYWQYFMPWKKRSHVMMSWVPRSWVYKGPWSPSSWTFISSRGKSSGLLLLGWRQALTRLGCRLSQEDFIDNGERWLE